MRVSQQLHGTYKLNVQLAKILSKMKSNDVYIACSLDTQLGAKFVHEYICAGGVNVLLRECGWEEPTPLRKFP